MRRRAARRSSGAARVGFVLLGCAALVGVFAWAASLIPEQGPPQWAETAGDTPSVSSPVEPGAGQPSDPASPAGPPGVETLASRDVTPGNATRGAQIGEAPLVRLPPRPSLSQSEAEEPVIERPVRQTLLHRPVALDAATIQVGDGTVALAGVAPLPAARTCAAAPGGASWPCGMRARTAVRAYLRGRAVRCEAPEDFGRQSESIESACTLAGADIGAWIVSNGWAEAAPGGPYADAEAEARAARRGIWR